jgi:hypothetical protein
MSYFHGGLGVKGQVRQAFDRIFAEIVPAPVVDAGTRKDGGPSYLVHYGNKKIIKDLVISDDDQGSWLALLGTPLVVMRSGEEEKAFLAEFLGDPARMLRDRIDGNFAVLAYDGRHRRFIAATDFNSTTPVFYTNSADGFWVSSHELPLARLTGPEIDPFGFCHPVYLGVSWDVFTRFQGIRKMVPNQILLVDEHRHMRTEFYWRPGDEPEWPGSLDDQIERWLSLLQKAVQGYYECSGRRPAICDFTAGEDSRLIVAQCHALGIPIRTHVTGLEHDTDVLLARSASQKLGLELIERRKEWITEEQLLGNVTDIGLKSDAYQELTKACIEFASDSADPVDDWGNVKYGGVPGGEAFRGSYYLRGKALFPARRSQLDLKFFVRMKYLLDFFPGLMKYPDDDFIKGIHRIAANRLEDVKKFSIGTQIDHMLRSFQTSLLIGLKYRNPLYLPLATGPLTRSIYGLSPRYKKNARLTRACTEILYPELARIRNQKGVPTIRKTIIRQPLFFPEKYAVVRDIANGAMSRLFKWKQSNKWYYQQDRNSYIFTTLFKTAPYSGWFASSKTMLTGGLYKPEILNMILDKAKAGSCRWLPILGRIVNQELACRWVYRESR